jgi:hypothetical protein
MGDSNTKLLQVVSLQNHLQKSNDDQISDLIKFNSSKFVHVSSLEIFGSIMIYMFQGVHRLQICSNWIYKTKVMNFMVFVSHFAILFFISKLYTAPLLFLCTSVFYHSKESRDAWFVNFGQVFDFILILQVAAEI